MIECITLVSQDCKAGTWVGIAPLIKLGASGEGEQPIRRRDLKSLVGITDSRRDRIPARASQLHVKILAGVVERTPGCRPALCPVIQLGVDLRDLLLDRTR